MTYNLYLKNISMQWITKYMEKQFLRPIRYMESTLILVYVNLFNICSKLKIHTNIYHFIYDNWNKNTGFALKALQM